MFMFVLMLLFASNAQFGRVRLLADPESKQSSPLCLVCLLAHFAPDALMSTSFSSLKPCFLVATDPLL